MGAGRSVQAADVIAAQGHSERAPGSAVSQTHPAVPAHHPATPNGNQAGDLSFNLTFSGRADSARQNGL